MLSKRICAIALSVTFLLTGLASAGETGKASLPDGFMYMVSVPSTSNLVDNIDSFVASCTRKTQNALPEGMVKAMAQMFIPGISVIADNDLELHILCPVDQKDDGVLGIVVANTNLESLLAILADNMFDFEETENGVMKIGVPKMPPLFAIDYDGKHTLIGSHEVTLQLVKKALDNGWEAAPWGKGVLSIAGDINKNWSNEILHSTILENGLADIREHVTNFENKEIELPDHLRDLILQTMDVAEEYIPALKSEIASIDTIRVDVGLDADKVEFLTLVKSPSDRYLGKLAEAAESLGNSNSPFTKNIDESAISLVLVAPIEKAFPGLIQASLDFYKKIVDKSDSSELKTALAKLDAIKEINIGDIVVGQYVQDEALGQIGWIACDDPAKALRVYTESYRAFNDIVIGIEPAYKDNPPVIVKSGKTSDGVEYSNIELSREFVVSFAQALTPGDAEKINDKLLDDFGGFSYYFAADKDNLVFTAGKDGLALLESALEDSNGVADPLWDSVFVQRMLAEMPARQTMTAFIDYAFLMNFFTMATLENMAADNDYADDEYLPEAFADIKSKVRTANSKVAIGMGALDGNLVYHCIIPADTINIIYYNMNILYSSLESARQKQMIEEYDENADEEDFSFDEEDGEEAE